MDSSFLNKAIQTERGVIDLGLGEFSNKNSSTREILEFSVERALNQGVLYTDGFGSEKLRKKIALYHNHKEIFLKILLNQDFPDVEIGNLIGNEINPYIFYNFIEKNDDEIDSQEVSELQLVKEYSGDKSSFDIIYETKIANNKGEIEIVYRTDLYDGSTAEYLSNSILKLLDVILYKGQDSLKVGEIIL